jgi:hypothetical protein
MEWNQIDWELQKEQIQSRWDRLTADDLDTIGGVREVLADKLRERYTMDEREAEAEIAAFLDSMP